MNGQRRGQITKNRILEEACKVFAEKGFRDATHAEICRRARTNTAAINYYFGAKQILYKAAFEYLTQKAETLYPLDGGLPSTAASDKRLWALIHAHLCRMFDPERLGALHRILMAERFDPTGLLVELLDSRLDQDRTLIQEIIRELLGPGAMQKEVEWCEMSIVSQCFMAAPGPGDDEGPRTIFGITEAEINCLADHILKFSLAGVKAISRNNHGHTNTATRSDETNATRSGKDDDES